MAVLNFENINKCPFLGMGEWEIPAISGIKSIEMPEKWVSFSECRKEKEPANCGVHFFIDDYRFQAVWTHPDRYIDLLRRFKIVLSPDFSMYTDMPRALQLYNHYRKQWLSAYWQKCGITVIPTISWSDAESFAWCFDGIPCGGIVAVSSVGTQKRKAAKEAFASGYERMNQELTPETVLYHGIVHDTSCKNIVQIGTVFTDRFRKGD